MLGGLSLIAFYFTKNYILLALFAAMSTLGMDSAWTVFDIEAGLLAKKGEEGKVESSFMFAKNLGWDLSPLFFGFAAQYYGIRAPFAIIGLGIIVVAMFFLSNREVK